MLNEWQPEFNGNLLRFTLHWYGMSPLFKALIEQSPAVSIKRLVLQPENNGTLAVELLLEDPGETITGVDVVK